MLRFRSLGVVLAGVLLVGAMALVTPNSAHASPAPAAKAGNKATSNAQFFVTLYGFVDNSPPSAIISNPIIHSQAGGTGTFSDPVTFATDVREEKPGTIVYYSFLKKYFIMEDTCTECTKDWNNKNGGNGDNPVPPRSGHRWRIDMWAGGDDRSLQDPDMTALLNCEDALTQPNGGTVTLNPPSNEPVDTTPIYNADTRQCFQP